jgi:hypothetical protein
MMNRKGRGLTWKKSNEDQSACGLDYALSNPTRAQEAARGKKMKRPKLRDMTDLERARLRLFQARHGAERCLQNLDGKELSSDARFSKRMLQCIIAATEPTEVDKEDLSAAISMMKYVATVTGEIDGTLH